MPAGYSKMVSLRDLLRQAVRGPNVPDSVVAKVILLSGELPAECIYPGCRNSRRTRGLCHGHYQTMRSYVRAGKADEADLEARGLLLSSGVGGGEATVGHDLFLRREGGE